MFIKKSYPSRKQMKVCLFGTYETNQMNLLLKKKLELQMIDYVECQENGSNIRSIVGSYSKLWKKHRNLSYDIMILPLWRSLFSLPLAKLISKGPIVYYGYMPIYDTLVNDRKWLNPRSIKAKIILLAEKLCWKFSDMVIKESHAEIEFCSKWFGLDKEKSRRVLISTDDSNVRPCNFKKPGEFFIVLYFGTYIPHHGVDTIIEAAKILSNEREIIFKLCGTGQTKEEMEEIAKKYQLENVEFLGWLSEEKFRNVIKESDVCLGVFGDQNKADYGITNKAYEILCSQKPLLTRDSKAMREINAKNGENCMLVPNKNPKKLSEAILYLKNNQEKRKEIAINGRRLYEESLSMKKSSEQLLKNLQELSKLQ